MRKLASIQKIKSIRPIEGADRIEIAEVLGWQCVVNKGQFKEGDLAVYFEIDSFLPVRPEFEFLRASSFKNSEILGEGFRLRTMKFKGEISQGLLLPLTGVFFYYENGSKEDLTHIHHDTNDGRLTIMEDNTFLRPLAEGNDLTEFLGVRKWEIPEMATTGGTVIGPLPGSVPHTDETRIQNIPEIFSEFKGLEYYISTKMDGSSHSVCVDENGFHATGHNYEYKDDGKSSFYEYVKKLDLPEKFAAFKSKKGLSSLVLQGEYCGPGIQKNPMKLKGPMWYVFTVIEDGKRVGLKEMQRVCEALDLPTVPIEEVGFDLPSKYPDAKALLERAEGTYETGGRKEGIVVRPTEPVFSKTVSSSLSLKAVSNKYLLKNE